MVVPLYPTPAFPARTGTVNGLLVTGTFTAQNLTGPLQGMTLSDLVTQINNGQIYVNVHTTAHPAGEIRGQVEEQ